MTQARIHRANIWINGCCLQLSVVHCTIKIQASVSFFLLLFFSVTTSNLRDFGNELNMTNALGSSTWPKVDETSLTSALPLGLRCFESGLVTLNG